MAIDDDQYYFINQSYEAMTLINQYLAPCTNHDDIVMYNYNGFYWDSLERSSGGAIYMAFGWDNGSNNNLHFIANTYGGKTSGYKVRAFVAF